AHHQVFGDGQVGEYTAPVGGYSNSLLHDETSGRLRDFLIMETASSAVRARRPAYRKEARRLACAIRADQRVDFAFFDLDRNIVQGLNGPVKRMNVFQLKH